MTPIINSRLADMPYLVRKTLTDYPLELLAARRAAFVKQIREYDAKSDGLWKSDPDTVEGETNLSDWEDERTSRPFPF